MEPEPIEFDYKPRWRMIVIPTVIGVPGAICSGWLAVFNQRAVVMNGRVVAAGDAKYISWAFCAFFLMLVAIGALHLYQRFGLRRRIVLGRDAFVYPSSSWSEATRAIVYREIETIRAGVGPKASLFVLIRAPGTKLRIEVGLLTSDEAFNDFCRVLADRVAAAGGARIDGATMIVAGVSKVRDRNLAREFLVMSWLAIAAAALILCGSISFWMTTRSVPTAGLVVGAIVLACGMGLRYVAKRELRRHAEATPSNSTTGR